MATLALNKKIGDWVDSIDLEDQNSASTSRYPKFLPSLSKLRVHRLVRNAQLAPNTVLSSEVQKLPSSLTELELTAFRVIDPFRAFSPSLFGSEVDRISPISEAEDFYWNVASKIPHLVKLVVKQPKFVAEAPIALRCTLPTTFLRSLPANLQHLEMHALCGSEKARLLPSSLQTLILTDRRAPWEMLLGTGDDAEEADHGPPKIDHLQFKVCKLDWPAGLSSINRSNLTTLSLMLPYNH